MDKTNKVEIPQCLALQTCKTEIRNAIGKTNLPAWVLVDALENILKDVKAQADMIMRMETESYKTALAEAEAKTEGENDGNN